MRRLLAFGAVIALLVSACMPAAGPGSVNPARLAGADWQLVNIQYADGELSEPAFGVYSLEFDTEEDRLFVTADCNSGSASFEANDDGSLVLSPITLTRMACPAGSISNEFVTELGLASAYAFEGDYLVLRNLDGTSLVFSR